MDTVKTPEIHLIRQRLLLIVLPVFFFTSCEQYYKDGFQLDLPSEERINVSFPGLADFVIIQTVTPDKRGGIAEVANRMMIANASNQTVNRLRFILNIFDSNARYQNNLLVSYMDSLRQPLDPFERTPEKLFNNSISLPLSADLIDIVILDQDAQDTHPLSGAYTGEAFYYSGGGAVAVNIPFVKGAIDYQGDLTLSASGAATYHIIAGRVSVSGQFIGQITSSAADGLKGGLKNTPGSQILLQQDSLTIKLVPGEAPPASLDSITLVLTRN